MKINKKYKHEYVCCLPKNIEKIIMQIVKRKIKTLYLTKTEKQTAIENAYVSKVCDLEDTIRIEYI